MLRLSRRTEHFWATLCLCNYFSVVRWEGDLDSSSSWHTSPYWVHRSEENECGRTDTYRPVFSFFIFHLTDWTETAEKSCCRILPPSFMGCWALKTCTLAWRWPVADFKNITLINHLNPTTKTWAGVLKPVCQQICFRSLKLTYVTVHPYQVTFRNGLLISLCTPVRVGE